MADNIYLSGAINTRSLDEQNKQVALYKENDWELKGGPSTHKIKVSIPADRVRDFCDWLQTQPQDQKVERFTTRTGEEVERRYVSFYMDGKEMSDTWVKLSKTVKTDSSMPF
jgi:hypothetical protein